MSELAAALPDRVRNAAHAVMRQACDAGLGIVTAESCTGGLLASLLTDIPGCSHAFERGFVTYSNDAKRELLGVPAALLESPGPVSEEVARAMAEGALRHSKADIGLAVTGFADSVPGGEPGLVHFAAARRGAPTRHRMERFGPLGRAEVRIRSLDVSLRLIWAAMSGRRG